MKKRWLAIGLAALVLTLSACGGGAGSGEASADQPGSEASSAPETPAESSAESGTEQTEGSAGSYYEEEESTVETPPLTYKMAPIYVQEEPNEYGRACSNYVIEINELGFSIWNIAVYDKTSGELLNWANDYEWTGYPGWICVDERPHYGYRYQDEWLPNWETDRSTYVVTVEHKGEALGPDDIQIVAEMEYQGQSAGDYTFEVNAELDEISVNASPVVHGFSLLKLGDEYFLPEINATGACGGFDEEGDYSYDGWSYTFIHLSGGEYDPEEFRDSFSAVSWDEESKTFVDYEIPAGYKEARLIDPDVNRFDLILGLQTSYDEDVPYELIENILPAYDDGTQKIVFCWS